MRRDAAAGRMEKAPPRSGGALFGRAGHRLYRGGFGGAHKSPYKQNGGIEYRTGAQRRDASGCRMEQAPTLRGGALLDGRRCVGRGECRTAPLNTYAAYVGAAA